MWRGIDELLCAHAARNYFSVRPELVEGRGKQPVLRQAQDERSERLKCHTHR